VIEKRITLTDVPTRPADATVVDQHPLEGSKAYDSGECRWRYAPDGHLIAFYRYAPRGERIAEGYWE
jgi:hypothetical protein